MLEKQIERHIIAFLEEIGLGPVYKINNTGTYDPVKRIYRRPSSNFKAGVPDIIFWLPDGRGAAIEVKSLTGKPTREQLNNINEINATKGFAFISRSVWQTYQNLIPVWPAIKSFDHIAKKYQQLEQTPKSRKEAML